VSLYRSIQEHREIPAIPRDYGWNELLRSPVRIYDVDANHFSILGKLRVQAVPEKLSANA
jgi:thioesterase domain-containing protein